MMIGFCILWCWASAADPLHDEGMLSPPHTPRFKKEDAPMQLAFIVKRLDAIDQKTIESHNFITEELRKVIQQASLETHELLKQRDIEKKQRPFYRFKYWIELIGIPLVNVVAIIAGVATVYRVYDEHKAILLTAEYQKEMLRTIVQLKQSLEQCYNITVSNS